jgi:hypothetical protein
MKIRVIGFSWKYTGAEFSELRTILDAESAKRMTQLKAALSSGKMGAWDGTIFTIADHGKYWVGVVLKIKDQERFCQVSASGGKLTLTAQDLAEGSKMAEVNFFLLNPATGNGIYQFYHQSTWVVRFNHTCRLAVNAHVLDKQRQLEKRGQDENLTKKQIAELKKAEDRDLVSEVVLKKEQFNELVDALAVVRKVTIRDDSLARPEMGAISSNANRAALSFTYTKDSPFSRIKESIVDFANKHHPWRMKVEGALADGSQEIINLTSNKDYFDECDFDEASKGMEVDLHDPGALINGSVMGKKIIETARKKRVAQMLG